LNTSPTFLAAATRRGILVPMIATARVPKALLWDVSADEIDEEAHRNFLIGRLLGLGSVEDIRTLRRNLGDVALRDYLRRTTARRLDRRRVRYLEAVLDLDPVEVDGWLSDPNRRVWDER
jgi:hypothetical protein